MPTTLTLTNMDSTISIKKINYEGQVRAGVKFNYEEEISMAFAQEAVFMLIISVIANLQDEDKKLFLQSIRKNVLNLFNKPEEEVFDLFLKRLEAINL